MSMNVQDLLKKKKENQELSYDELKYFIGGACNETIHPAQIGAMLMAIAINGLSKNETISLTKTMIESGNKLKWDEGIVADKHSTGGVGDKVSIVLAPALAACGLKVPMMSGRGLELTGGTLDKLESIPGYSINLTKEQMDKCLKEAGCFISGATSDLCPGDRATYCIRDVTATVKSNSLIIGSILSKKIAEGSKYLLLDVKVGKAALYQTLAEAEQFAKEIVSVSKELELMTRCVLTKMDEPIGKCVGNAIEIKECVDCLNEPSNGPEDLIELVKYLGGELLEMTKIASDVKQGKAMINQALSSGQALARFEKMLICQGVTPDVAKSLCKQKYGEVLPLSAKHETFTAKTSGYVKEIRALPIAIVCKELGSGRNKPTDNVDPSVGIQLLCNTGDHVKTGDSLFKLYHNKSSLNEEIYKLINDIIEISLIKDNNFVGNKIIKVI